MGSWNTTGSIQSLTTVGGDSGMVVFKPTGREAAGVPRWMRRLVAVRPTPHGVGLGRGQCEP